MTYLDCKDYQGGYCLIQKNSFGINRTCCERNDCPELYSQRKSINWDKIRNLPKSKKDSIKKK